MRYAIVIEKAESNYAAYVPDLPGCVTTGATVAAVSKALRKAGAVRIDILTFSRVLPGDFRDEELATI